MLPGLHRVRARSKSSVTEYWYAWRGGPQIMKVKGRSDAEVDRLVSEQAAEAVRAHQAKPTGDKVTLYGLITRYLEGLDDMPGADRTKRDLRTYLDKVRTELGELELKALQASGARRFLIDWRDGFKATPKVADERMKALSKVISWAVDRGELTSNPIEGVDGLYTPPNRAELIWEPHQLETLLHKGDRDFIDFVEVACHTGLRLGDLREIPLNAVVKDKKIGDAIVFQTGKSNRRRTAVVPITDELRVILQRVVAQHRGKATTLLASSRGYPWSEAGLEAAIQRHRERALERAQERGEQTSGIEGLRIHDMRGTAATNYIRAGLDDADIAVILGWKSERVAEIRRRYVSGQEIGLAIVRRMKENKARAAAVKGL